MFVWETQAQKVIKLHLATIAPPPGVKERILDDLEKKSRGREMLGWFFFSPRLAGSFALLVVVALAAVLWRNNNQEDFLRAAVDQYRMVLGRGSGAFRSGGLSTPATRRLDLSPWGYRLSANQIKQVKGREQRLSLFEGKANEYVLAQEFDGADLSPSPDAMVTRAEGREFVSYSQDRVNLVAWKDNGLLCILTSKLPSETLLALAKQVAGRS